MAGDEEVIGAGAHAHDVDVDHGVIPSPLDDVCGDCRAIHDVEALEAHEVVKPRPVPSRDDRAILAHATACAAHRASADIDPHAVHRPLLVAGLPAFHRGL